MVVIWKMCKVVYIVNIVMKIIMIMNFSVYVMIFGYMIIIFVVNMKNNGDIMYVANKNFDKHYSKHNKFYKKYYHNVNKNYYDFYLRCQFNNRVKKVRNHKNYYISMQYNIRKPRNKYIFKSYIR